MPVLSSKFFHLPIKTQLFFTCWKSYIIFSAYTVPEQNNFVIFKNFEFKMFCRERNHAPLKATLCGVFSFERKFCFLIYSKSIATPVKQLIRNVIVCNSIKSHLNAKVVNNWHLCLNWFLPSLKVNLLGLLGSH